MKLIAFLALTILSAPVSAIQLKMTSFDQLNVQATLDGTSYTGGGIAYFTLMEAMLNYSLGDEILAMCLEPDEYVSIGSTYDFDLVELADAPTSGNFGTANADAYSTLSPATTSTSYQAWALLNNGRVNTRGVYRGQDFVFFEPQNVPEPMPLALMGLGMLGFIGVRKWTA